MASEGARAGLWVWHGNWGGAFGTRVEEAISCQHSALGFSFQEGTLGCPL